MKYLLGIDNGGTFVKAGISDKNGRLVAVAKEKIHNLTPYPGFTERNMDELWEQNVKVIKRAIEMSGIDAKDIAGISFSGHGKGLYLVGEDGQPAYSGILSTDTRAWKEVKKWKEDGTAKKVYQKTLQEILPGQPVSLLAWLKEREPEVVEKTKYIFSVNDYIRYCMTGKANGEYTTFSGANLINLKTLEYDRELLGYFGLDGVYDKLPPLKFPTDICGGVTCRAAALTGLSEGTPVMAGMFDVDACGIASGIYDETSLCMIAGTWSINEYITHEPIINGTVSLNSMFCIPGYFLIEESSPTSAGNMQWFLDELLAEWKNSPAEGTKNIYDVVNGWVSGIEPWECNIIFLPFLNGSNEDALAKGSFVGLTDFHDRRHMLRAVYEGIVFSHMVHVKRLLKNRRKPDAIRLAGGAANSEVWAQIFADALQIPIEIVECQEQGIMGATMAAGIGAGIYRTYEEAIRKFVRISKKILPRPEYREIYEKKYQNYRMVVKALSGVWERLQEGAGTGNV